MVGPSARSQLEVQATWLGVGPEITATRQERSQPGHPFLFPKIQFRTKTSKKEGGDAFVTLSSCHTAVFFLFGNSGI
jgi:hypothetical protein